MRLSEVLILTIGGLILYRSGRKIESEINPDGQVDIVARTIWGEARGEGANGMQAVANVIMNRVERGGWYGLTPAEVCKKPLQFSCWNSNDPNYKPMLSVTDSDKEFRQALEIATKAVTGQLPDITGGATEYHAKSIKPSSWNWHKLTQTTTIGDHIFYRSVA